MQNCLGGIYLNECYGCRIADVDIELMAAWDPCLSLWAGVNGCTFESVTCSAHPASGKAPRIVELHDGPSGNRFTGGLYYNQDTPSPIVSLFGPWTQGNHFKGGYYVGNAALLAAFEIEGAMFTVIDPPAMNGVPIRRELVDHGSMTQVRGPWIHV